MKRRLLLFVVLALLAMSTVSACTALGQPLLYGVQVSPERIRPDGTGISSEAAIHYAIGRRAYVTISVLTPDGRSHVLRDNLLRAPDQYQTRFDGSVTVDSGPNRRLLPDGVYTIKVRAVDTSGTQTEQSSNILIENADTSSLEITNLVIRPTTITPNNDGKDDEATISYSLSKKAQVSIFATSEDGGYALLQPPTEQQGEAGMAAPWDGKENGGRLLPNGAYMVHIRAVDKAGNVTEAAQEVTVENGGTPRMAITKVKFWPPIVPVNGILRVEITVKNIGDTIIQQLGPDPGTRYSLSSTYASFRDADGKPTYYERPGYWRVGIMWNNAAMPYPVRWGFGKDLAPGDETTVRGEILIDEKMPYTGTYFWAGIEQGGVGFHDTNKGQTEIRFAY